MKKLTFAAAFIAVAFTLSNCSKEANDAKEATKTGQNSNNPSQNNGSNSGQNNDSNTGQQGNNSGQNGGTIVTNDYEISPDGKILLRWFNNKVTEIDMQSDPNLSKVTSIHNRAFYAHRSLKKIVLPQGLESIGDEAFRKCELLEDVIFPEGLRKIGEGAFEGCDLRNIIIPGSVTSIERRVFAYNKNLNIVTFRGMIPPSIYRNTFIEGDLIESGVYDLTFYVPVNKVEDYSRSFAKADIGKRIEPTTITSVIETKNYRLSSDGKVLLFWKDGEATSVDMQADDTLRKVTEIAPYAFYRRNIHSIILPQNLESIGDRAFYGDQLTSLTIPKSVTNMGKHTFTDNDQLTSLTFEGTTPPLIDKQLFEGTFFPDKIKVVYVPTGSVEAYKDALPRYAHIIRTKE